jgi:hypothetical protein
LRSDRDFLQQSIGDEGMRTLAEVLRMAANEDLGAPDLVVVFGSRARNVGQDGSDVDVCFEAGWIPAEPDRMPRLRLPQDQLVFDLMTFPRGLLLGRLRVQDEVARAIVREGGYTRTPTAGTATH